MPDAVDAAQPVQVAVLTWLHAQEIDQATEPLAAVALKLAEVLDSGRALMAAAATSRELREVLSVLAGETTDDDKFDAWLAGLSAPLQHATDAR
jgi:hypothetical protein